MMICGDCIEEMRAMPSGKFRAVVTSPPYNLRSTTRPKKTSFARKTTLFNEGYDGYEDNLPRDEYIAWQRECLTEMMRLTAEDGAIFYNHHWRVQKHLLERPEEIIEGFPLRQIVIWHRAGGVNFQPTFFLPNYEVIYVIARPAFSIAGGANKYGAIWQMAQDAKNPHPAPFPVELPLRCLRAVGSGPVLDPFAGSGTTGVAAKELGFEFVGIERSEEYCRQAEKRIGEAAQSDWIDGACKPARFGYTWAAGSGSVPPSSPKGDSRMEEIRDQTVGVMLTATEKRQLRELAYSKGVSLSKAAHGILSARLKQVEARKTKKEAKG